MRRVLPKKGRKKRDATPKIIYAIALLAYAAWGGWVWVLFNITPNSPTNQALFLGSGSLAVFLTFLFLFYEIGRIITRKAPQVVFYPAARRAGFLSAVVVALGGMKLIGILNFINGGLLALIVFLVEVQISRSSGEQNPSS